MSCVVVGSVTEPGGCVTIPTVPAQNVAAVAPHLHALAFTGFDLVPLLVAAVGGILGGAAMSFWHRPRP